MHGVPGSFAFHHQVREVFVEQVTYYFDQHVWFFVHGDGLGAFAVFLFVGALLDLLPCVVQAAHVGGDFGFVDAFGGGADDGSAFVRYHVFDDALQAFALVFGKFPGDAGSAPAGHVHQVAASQGDLRGQACAFVANGVFGDLHQHLVAAFEGLFDFPAATPKPTGAPVHFPGVEHTVAAFADVNEGGFHGGQHVLHAPEVDVSYQ